MQSPLIVAHRGASQLAPENSCAAFDLAIQNGADVIEFDIHLSRDGQIVVHHDYYLGRTETGAGFIGDYAFSELRALDIGVKFGEKFSGTKMPTFREVLDLGRGKIRFEIELRGPTLPFLTAVIDEINQVGVLNDVEMTSPHVPLLMHARNMVPAIRTGIFFPSFPAWVEKNLGRQHVLDWMVLVDAQVAHLPLELIDEEFVHALRGRNHIVHAADLNSEREIRSAIRSQVDQFSTDILETAVKIRESMNPC